MNYLSILGNKTYVIRIVLGLIVIAFVTYFYFDYKSLKQDKVDLTAKIAKKDQVIRNYVSDFKNLEKEKLKLETFYQDQLERQKSIIIFKEKEQQVFTTKFNKVKKEITLKKTKNEKENLKILFDELRKLN